MFHEITLQKVFWSCSFQLGLHKLSLINKCEGFNIPQLYYNFFDNCPETSGMAGGLSPYCFFSLSEVTFFFKTMLELETSLRADWKNVNFFWVLWISFQRTTSSLIKGNEQSEEKYFFWEKLLALYFMREAWFQVNQLYVGRRFGSQCQVAVDYIPLKGASVLVSRLTADGFI